MVSVTGLTTFVVPLDRLAGLSAEQLASAGDSARVRVRRDGGTFAFRGVFRGGRGAGRLGFAPDPAFGDALARRGVGRPTPAQGFSLALHDVSLAFLDELDARGYATPTPAALVTLGVSGADLGYLRAVSALGCRFGTTGALVAFSNSGVTPEFIRGVRQLGHRDVAAADLVRLRNHSLGTDAIARLNARAGRRLAVAELVALRDSGAASAPERVSDRESPPAAGAAPAAAPGAGSTPLSGSWAVLGTRGGYANLRLNWDDGTNWDRWVPIAALRGTSGEAIASATRAPAAFRIEEDAGLLEFDGSFEGGRGTGPLRFRPDRAFGATLRALGVTGADAVSDHQLKNLTWGGVSAEAVRGFLDAGVAPLTLRQAVDLAIYQVTPDYVRALRALSPGGRAEAADATHLRHSGVPATYLRELAALGFRDLPAAEVLALWRERVTPGFVRAVRESGAGGRGPVRARARRLTGPLALAAGAPLRSCASAASPPRSGGARAAAARCRRAPRRRAVVTGAGGFVGHRLARYLKAEGYRVRGADLTLPGFAPSAADDYDDGRDTAPLTEA